MAARTHRGKIRFAAAAIAVFALLPAPSGWAQGGLGPAPLSESGRFMNTDVEMTHGSLGVRLPFFLRRIAGSFRSASTGLAIVANDGAFLRENARHSVPTVTWVGHATLLVQMDHVTFLTDPIWSERPSPLPFAGPRRLAKPGIAIAALPPIDFVVISHNHYDHLDLASLEDLAERNPEAHFLVPLMNGDLLRERGIRKVHELDWGAVWSFEGVRVHCLPAQHWSRRGLFDEGRALWASWAVTGSDRRFYFGGDTGYFSGFARIGEALGPFDLAALPIGAYLPVAMMKQSHLNPEEAVASGLELRARRLLGMHFGTFDLSDEPVEEPPRRFHDAAREQGIEDDRVWTLDIGETRKF